jgi:GNAT superfamily N-acetyltransferase
MGTGQTVWYLEMTSPDQLRPATRPAPAHTLRRVAPSAELSRFFYHEVGRDWRWTDRAAWSDDDWRAWVARPGYELWIGEVGGARAGYGELDAVDGEVELAYFGLLPAFTHQGLGGALLTALVRRAWAVPARRVWVHTCTDDDPVALPNYLARGFALYRTEEP